MSEFGRFELLFKRDRHRTRRTNASVAVVVPVYNAARVLNVSLGALRNLLDGAFPAHTVVIANNASTDSTLEQARCIASGSRNVEVVHLAAKGRGLAIKTAWGSSEAQFLAYMDVDLSTDLRAFTSLIDPLESDGYDMAIGSRLQPTSCTRRCLKREVLSRSYNLLVRAAFGTHFSDAQCGFKAITKQAADELLPLVEDNGWFFDTELLVLAEKLGYRIFDLPVRWTENSDSTVRIWRTAIEDIKGIIRLHRNLARGKYRGFERRNVSTPVFRGPLEC